MRRQILSLLFRRRVAFYVIFTFTLFLLQTPVLTLSENIFNDEVVSPVSKSANTLVKIVIPTPTFKPTPTTTPIIKPISTKPPVPTMILSPTILPIQETIRGAGDEVWDKLSLCESGEDWNLNTRNGYFGGLQFSQVAWNSVDGQGLPSDASREEQILRGKILQEKRGWSAWGICAQRLGLN